MKFYFVLKISFYKYNKQVNKIEKYIKYQENYKFKYVLKN